MELGCNQIWPKRYSYIEHLQNRYYSKSTKINQVEYSTNVRRNKRFFRGFQSSPHTNSSQYTPLNLSKYILIVIQKNPFKITKPEPNEEKTKNTKRQEKTPK